ncbi:MAG: hypothetical protein U0586_03090 [Candidatus Brocadiaceae bacterium]
MQEARSVTIGSNKTIKRTSDTLVMDRKPKLMDRFREALRSCHYSRRTRPQISQYAKRLALAMGLPAGKPVEEHNDR